MPETGDCRKQGSSGAQCWHCRGSGPRVSGMTPLNVTQRQQAGPAHPAGEALGHKPEPAPALEGREVEDWESSPHEQAELARSSVERGQRSRAGGHPGPPYIGGLQAALDLRSHVWMEMQTALPTGFRSPCSGLRARFSGSFSGGLRCRLVEFPAARTAPPDQLYQRVLHQIWKRPPGSAQHTGPTVWLEAQSFASKCDFSESLQ
ncbi:uncharacterized protein LOC134471339 [Cavia porcellus]|uniref:uncharacterized protein LOC134471339 n=1 Tax=Cavia porcellus TaxID=10141 RepID=UPI002FE11263